MSATIPLIDSRQVAQTFAMRREVRVPGQKGDECVLPEAQAYGSVLCDPRGSWKMWYLSEPAYCEYHAVSSDGVCWKRPELDLVCDAVRPALTGSNAFLSESQKDSSGRWLVESKGPEGFCVLDAELTPHPAAKCRYTAMYLARLSHGSGLCIAYSDDGIQWTAEEASPVMPGWHDTSNMMFYDTRINRYVWYGRPEACVSLGRRANRVIARAESEDMIRWSPEQTVLDTDDLDADPLEMVDEAQLRSGADPRDAKTRAEVIAAVTETKAVRTDDLSLIRGRNRQWYGITVFPCGDLYIGLGWMYDLPAGEMWVELLHSYDGIDWRRELVRKPFLPHRKGTCACTMGSPPVQVDDGIRIFYSTSNRNHHGVPAPDADRVPAGMRVHTLERDRWVSYAAYDHPGEILTQPMVRGERLGLNAVTCNNGAIRVALLDAQGTPLDGYSLEESMPLSGDSLDLVPSWQTQKSFAEIPVAQYRLRIVARNARIFALNV